MNTGNRKSDIDPKPQANDVPSTSYEKDLHPTGMADQNVGPQGGLHESGLQTAYDIKPLHQSLSSLQDDELKRIPVIPEGQRLQQGATYVDLANENPEEFTASGDMTATSGHFFVPKERVPYPLWNRIIDEVKPPRGE